MAFTPDFRASEFLADVSYLLLAVASRIRENSLNRKEIEHILTEVGERALSAGQLIDIARSAGHSAHHALTLLEAHVELIRYLASQNYTLSAASIKWYSYKKLLRRYRLPLFNQKLHCARARVIMQDVKAEEAFIRNSLSLDQVSQLFDSCWKSLT